MPTGSLLITKHEFLAKLKQVQCPWELIWEEEFNNRSEAMNLERKIKTRGIGRLSDDKTGGWEGLSAIFRCPEEHGVHCKSHTRINDYRLI